MINFLTRLSEWILKGGNLTFREIVRLSELNEQKDIVSLISFANLIREKYMGNRFNFYANINVGCGQCDGCDTCFQSPEFDFNIKDSLKSKREFIEGRAQYAADSGIDKYAFTACGKFPGDIGDSDSFTALFKNAPPSEKIISFTSFGMLKGDTAPLLQKFCIDKEGESPGNGGSPAADIEREAFLGERNRLLKKSRDSGFRTGSGASLWTGETAMQRLEVIYILKELDIDFVALYFSPLKKDTPPLHPMELLKMIAICRFIHPGKEIILCGSGWKNFNIVRTVMLLSGANAVMSGRFMAPAKRNALEDIKSLSNFSLFR